jgi:hypothetical protein
MKRKGWLIFGIVQLIGIATIFEAAFLQFPTLLLLSMALLLPGSVAWAELSWGRAGASLPLWTLGAISVGVNALLFVFVSFLIKKFRRSRQISPRSIP